MDIYLSTEETVDNVVYQETENRTWKFIQEFDKAKHSTISLGYKKYGLKEENHRSIPLISFIEGMKYLFRGFQTNYYEMYSEPQLMKARFDSISTRLGYKVFPREDLMDFLGTQFLNTHRDLDKAIFYLKYNTENYPLSINAWNNLSKAYNEKGDKINETTCKKKVLELKIKKMNLSKLTIITSLLLMFTANITFCQNTFGEDKSKINAIINTFMKCIKEKDTVSFNQLFAPDPVVWAGVYKPKSQHERVTKNNEFSNYFTGKYELFIKYLSPESRHEEKFYNIKIINDDAVGSVNFDYSFWENGVKQNWGKESWSMVKLDGNWKIAAVIFSMEMENVAKEPNQRRQ